MQRVEPLRAFGEHDFLSKRRFVPISAYWISERSGVVDDIFESEYEKRTSHLVKLGKSLNFWL
jgi:hypothetical protein